MVVDREISLSVQLCRELSSFLIYWLYNQQESQGGLYVSLHNFHGLGEQWLQLHHGKTKDRLFLHIIRREIPKVETYYILRNDSVIYNY